MVIFVQDIDKWDDIRRIAVFSPVATLRRQIGLVWLRSIVWVWLQDGDYVRVMIAAVMSLSSNCCWWVFTPLSAVDHKGILRRADEFILFDFSEALDKFQLTRQQSHYLSKRVTANKSLLIKDMCTLIDTAYMSLSLIATFDASMDYLWSHIQLNRLHQACQDCLVSEKVRQLSYTCSCHSSAGK